MTSTLNHRIAYMSANCNRKPHAFDVRDNIILYPSSQSICLYNIEQYTHLQIINHHSKQVCRTRWLRAKGGLQLNAFSSSSLDGTATLWAYEDSSRSYVKTFSVKGPESGFLTHDSAKVEWMEKNYSQIITCCSTNDERLFIWVDEDEAIVLDVNQFIFDINISVEDILPRGNVLIGYTGSDRNVHLISLHRDKKVEKLIELQGHEDWIQSIDIMTTSIGETFIASGSQDNFVRVWKLSNFDSIHSTRRGRIFSLEQKDFEVELETVLSGHEAWVYSVKFAIGNHNSLILLTASMDKSLILWQQPVENDIWIEKVRVGDVGGSALGFLGALLTPKLDTIFAHAFNGAFHVWSHDEDHNVWNPSVGLGGHVQTVTDLCWEPSGAFLLTCSKDQTTRLHAPWLREDKESWHELARPQIHGYDLNCLSSIDAVTFVSGAEEKVIRVLGATESFVSSIKNISQKELTACMKNKRELPKYASVPPLGLSNKAIYEDIDMDQHFKSVILSKPPLEETLQQNTLWPEIQKLFGHSYEISALACNHKGTILASACKASKFVNAGIFIWDIQENFQKIEEITFHSLTVTQLRFSPDDKLLLSVSRDRSWSLFKLSESDQQTTLKIASSGKNGGHNRIIWDVAWTPDSQFFITCSRDKRAIFWTLKDTDCNSTHVEALSSYSFQESIHTVDVANSKILRDFLVATGLESGLISLFLWNPESGWKPVLEIRCHHATINRIRFKPNINDLDGWLLASCGDDRKLCLHRLNLVGA